MPRILIADDDELIAELASEVLIDAGHACGWVTNAADAWQCARHKRPDLLLLDHGMPEESGMTLLRRLRQSAEFYDLPVIMFTAMRGDADRSQAMFAGAQDFLSKPFDAADLVRRVNHQLRLRADRPRHVDLRQAVHFEPSRTQFAAVAHRRML